MKTILLTLILLTNIGCENKPKKEISENPKVKNEILVVENKEPKEGRKSLIIPFNEYQIEFITKKDDLELLEKPRIKNDTLFIFGPDIAELESVNIRGLKTNEFKISQMYKSSLILQFDGKAFEMKNWKEYKSEWFTNSNRKKYKNVFRKRLRKISRLQ